MIAFSVAVVALSAQLPEQRPGGYFEASAGAPIAHYLPYGDAVEAEHLVTGAQLQAAAGGYAMHWEWVRLDVGLRLSRMRLDVQGSYDTGARDDAFRAGFEFLGAGLEVLASTRLGGRVDPVLGLSLGTAAFISDRLGAQTQLEWIPVYGAFVVGVWIHLADWVELRTALQWVPPVENLNVVTPELAMRVRI